MATSYRCKYDSKHHHKILENIIGGSRRKKSVFSTIDFTRHPVASDIKTHKMKQNGAA